MTSRWLVLSSLTLCYVVGELAHFLLGVVARPLARDVKFGVVECVQNGNYSLRGNSSLGENCHRFKNKLSCENWSSGYAGEGPCEWNYSGLGIEYQVVAGPSFIFVFTICGVIWGILGDRYNRATLIKIAALLLTIATVLTGASTKYWHVVILRILVGAGDSAITPLGCSLISSYFERSKRGLATGIFNWGIYFGYGLAYIFGNFLTNTLLTEGWRMAFYVSGGLGCLAFICSLMAVKSPENRQNFNTEISENSRKNLGSAEIPEKSDIFVSTHSELSVLKFRSEEFSGTYIPNLDKKLNSNLKFTENSDNISNNLDKFTENFEEIGKSTGLVKENCGIIFIVLQSLCTLPMVLLVASSCVRHTAGFTWAYNTQLYFKTYYPSYNLGVWISSVSIAGGTLGVAIGGLVSDKLMKKLGQKSRLYVLAGSQLLATPFAVGVLILRPPGAFYSLLASYLFAEMWFSALFATLLDMVPPKAQSVCIAVFIFVMNNVGGNAPLLVEPLKVATSYRTALLLMYPGMYFLSSILFLATSCFVK